MLNWFKKKLGVATYSQQPNIAEAIAGLPIHHRGTAGITVNEKSALNFAAVWACVRLISETEATLPFPVYQFLTGGGKQRERQHPVYPLLNDSPDGILTSLQWREASIGHVLTRGNTYSEIEFDTSGHPLALHLNPPDKVTPERTKAGDVVYKVEGSSVRVPAWKMLHFAGLGYDGLIGYSPIKQMARAIGLGMACEAFGSAWFENGARGGGVLSSPKSLTPQARKNVTESLKDIHGGPENSGQWMFFEEGITATTLSVPPEESQFLQTRTFQLQEICRAFRVEPALIQENSRSTFSNVEQQTLNFIVHCIRPMCVRIEAEINRKLFPEDGDLYFAEHLIDGLARGDTATRYAAYNIGLQAGFLCKDEVREWENLNPIPDGAGKIFLTPLNMAPAAQPPTPSPTPQPAPQAKPEAVQASWDCVRDNLGRMLRREAEGIRSAAKKDNPAQAVEEFYRGFSPICKQALEPSLKAYATLTAKDLDSCMLLLGLPGQIVASGLDAVLAAIYNKQDIETVIAIRAAKDWRA